MFSGTIFPLVNQTVFIHVSELENEISVAYDWGLFLTGTSIVAMALAFVCFVKPSLWLVAGVPC